MDLKTLPIGFRPFSLVTWILICLNTIIFGWLYMLPDVLTQTVVDRFGFAPYYFNVVVVGWNPYYTILTHMFMHVTFDHWLANMIFLWMMGGILEPMWGMLKFLFVYLLSGVVAVGGYYWSTYEYTITPLIGASGAVAGLIGAFLVLGLGRFKELTDVQIGWWVYSGTWAVYQIFNVMWFSEYEIEHGVAHWDHVGGLLFGGVVMWWCWNRRFRGKKVVQYTLW